MSVPPRVEMLGGLRVVLPDRTITRFRTEKTASFLAYLAYHADRPHPREVLVEMLWPRGDPHAGRDSLSVALSWLRHELEPSCARLSSLIVADRFSISMNGIATDVAEFEAALRAAAAAPVDAERAAICEGALNLYRGPLLRGMYEDWVLPEQRRLHERYFRALHCLMGCLERAGDVGGALERAESGLAMDPRREDLRRDLMRLLWVSGRVRDALGLYHDLRRLLESDGGDEPEPATQALAKQIAADAGLRPGRLARPTSFAKPRASVNRRFSESVPNFPLSAAPCKPPVSLL